MALLQDGQSIRGTYEVERFLGEGAFAEVYRVKHRFMGRQAMKVFKTAGATLEELEKDIAEAILLSSIKHPNIVEVYDANTVEIRAQEHGYFTMTYMPGGTLERHWRSFGDRLMPVDQVVETVKQACRGLAVAHSHKPPIVHRDIKPQNVLVGFGSDGVHVRLSDFGLAKAVNPLTLIASSKGTPGFKPPEAFENIDSCTADIWPVGTTMYLLLTEEMPYPVLGGGMEGLTGDVGRFLRPLRPASMYNVHADAGLESIISRCLAKDPKDRYQNASDLLADLEQWKPGSQAGETTKSQSLSASGEKTALPARSQHNLKQEAEEDLKGAFHAAEHATGLTS